MKAKRPGSRKKRIIILYSLGVLVPGLILGYMAFRGIMNDQAIREKESRNRLESVRETFFTALDSALYTDFQNSFGENLDINSEQDDAVRASLVIPTTAEKDLINHNLLYLPPEFVGNPVSATLPSDIDLEKAQKLEFGTSQLSSALRQYRSIEKNTGNNDIKLKSLIGQARILRKLDRDSEAEAIYRIILDEYSDSYVGNNIPAQSMALLELARMHQESGKTEEQNNVLGEILTSLLNPQLAYGANHFNFMYRSIKELLKADDSLAQSQLAQFNEAALQTEEIGKLLANPDLIFSNRNMHIIPLGTGLFLRPIYYNDLIALSADSPDSESPGQRLLILDLNTRFISLAIELLSKADPEEMLNWKIQNGEDEIIFQTSEEARDYLDYSFPDGYPGWTLSLYENQPGVLASLLAPEKGVFLLVFVFITLMMIFGLLFTLHTLNQEIRLNRLKSEFISNVSHELKSPLTSIRQRAELLSQKRVNSPQKPEYYSTILDQSEQLSHLIENILDFSRIEDERKKYQFEETNMVPYVQKLVNSFNQRQISSKIRIELIADEGIPKIKIDREAITQVLYNLLDNAVKFSADSHNIEIGLTFSPVTSHQSPVTRHLSPVIIYVKDRGLGINKKDQQRIFERFYRAEEGRIQGIKGSGIGLTLVKRIVEAHSGQIRVESEPGKGSTFWIHLPLKQ